jgi:WD40-like Beta Propeller Repeat
VPSPERASFLQILVKLLRRRRGWDLAIVAALVALGAVALTDALRDPDDGRGGTSGQAATAATTEEREASATTTEEPQDGQTPTTSTTDEVEASAPRLPGGAASGLLAFTAPGACELRAIDLRSGRMLELPRVETSCELYAPRVGTRIAYRTLDYEGGARRPFSILDLENPRASFGTYVGNWIAWSPDGSTLAWCDHTLRSGFELARGQRPKRVDQCPWPDPTFDTASRRQYLPTPLPIDANLAPDNCAALVVRGDVVQLVDLGCFQGPAPPTFKGLSADWSPNGKWIAVVEPDAVVFHRVVGREASVRWDVVAGQLAWLSG